MAAPQLLHPTEALCVRGMASPSSSPAIAKRACDSCKHRKVKCDADSPACSNCRVSGLHCAYIIRPKKRGPRFRKSIHNSSSGIARQNQQPAPDSALQRPILRGPPTPQAETIPSSASPHTALLSAERGTSASTQEWSPNNIQHPSQTVPTPIDLAHNFARIHDRLVAAVSTALPGSSIEVLGAKCVDLYMQYIFPITPIVHEQSLRENVLLLRPQFRLLQSPEPHGWVTTNGQSVGDMDLAILQQFALVTAMCAEVASILPAHIFPEGSAVADHFLEASRDVLRLYHDRDVEFPQSSSLVIRYFHCNCTHAAGNIRLSWYLLGEAIRLAQEMRLYDESSLAGLNPVEALLRRNAFWQLYTGDKSSALLNGRPFTLHDFNHNSKTTLLHTPPEDTPLMDSTREQYTESFERRVMAGFNMCQRVWSLASDLLLNLRMFQPFSLRLLATQNLTEQQKTAIMDTYIQYISLLDNMPEWLRDPDGAQGLDNETNRYHQTSFVIQRVNLQVSFQCLRLIILQNFVDHGVQSLLGVVDEPLMIALRKTEIAHDMLSMIQKAPFEALQVNGESCVEKIRQVGASLLEITQNTANERVAERARADFTTLLDILARLNSRAGDSLAGYM